MQQSELSFKKIMFLNQASLTKYFIVYPRIKAFVDFGLDFDFDHNISNVDFGMFIFLL